MSMSTADDPTKVDIVSSISMILCLALFFASIKMTSPALSVVSAVGAGITAALRLLYERRRKA